jgi:hypothetical protein
MSSTTATVLVGTAHPNDADICPTHLVRLEEGDRAAWILTDLHGNRPQVISRPDAPDRIFADLLALIAAEVVHASVTTDNPVDLVRGLGRVALSFTIYPGSSQSAGVASALEPLDRGMGRVGLAADAMMLPRCRPGVTPTACGIGVARLAVRRSASGLLAR